MLKPKLQLRANGLMVISPRLQVLLGNWRQRRGTWALAQEERALEGIKHTRVRPGTRLVFPGEGLAGKLSLNWLLTVKESKISLEWCILESSRLTGYINSIKRGMVRVKMQQNE